MSSTPPLWSGRPAADDEHPWLSESAASGPRERAPAPEPPADRRGGVGRTAAFVALAALTALAGLAGLRLDAGDRAAREIGLLPAAGGRPGDTRINRIYADTSAGVVSVQIRRGGRLGSGTGFVIDSDGTIVTNAHVVGRATRAEVRFDDDVQPVDAEVAGSDPSSDLAVLRVDPGDVDRLKVLPLADSGRVRVGDTAIAVGYPLGLDRTATAGIVSGLGRQIQAPNGFSIDEVIQTDAPVNPGNSGGPLLDGDGRVIGVNSQIATAGGAGSVGIGFAVPSNTVREVVPQLKLGQSVARPFLGVSTTIAVGRTGAAVREVVPGSPADQAGLRIGAEPDGSDGDLIVEVDGRPVEEPDDVADALDGHRPGDEVPVEVLREGADRETLSVRLGRRP